MNMNSKKWHDWLLMANAIEFHGGDTFLDELRPLPGFSFWVAVSFLKV